MDKYEIASEPLTRLTVQYPGGGGMQCLAWELSAYDAVKTGETVLTATCQDGVTRRFMVAIDSIEGLHEGGKD